MTADNIFCSTRKVRVRLIPRQQRMLVNAAGIMRTFQRLCQLNQPDEAERRLCLMAKTWLGRSEYSLDMWDELIEYVGEGAEQEPEEEEQQSYSFG
jgi:hypothetical protein